MKIFNNRRIISQLGVLAMSLGLLACQFDLSELGSGNQAAQETGEVLIGLTDAQGDFSNYEVTVKSILLTKKNGAEVETLPQKTKVNFAEYVNMTEFVTAASVTSGEYTSASLVLDYADASIYVEDANGNAVQVTDVKDSDDTPVSEWKVKVELDRDKPLLIVPGVPAHLTLDFDLKASHSVEYNGEGKPVSIILEPVLLATVDAEAPKIHRLRGALKNVDVAANSFDVFVRPFRHKFGEDHGFGALTVVTSTTTLFEIDGESYVGNSGIAALDLLPNLSAVIVRGDLKLREKVFVAREVAAGSSVPGGEFDAVRGSVIKRVENLLTVRGATLIRTDGTVVFNDNVLISIDDTTRVRKQGMVGEFSVDDISVGQRITVLGVLNNSEIDKLHLDAVQGHVKLCYTDLHGLKTVDESSPYALVMDLSNINQRRVSLFDFTGTGVDAASDANPDAYEVETGSLSLSDLVQGTPLKVRGFVTPFGSAPADFDAVTVIDLAQVKATLVTNWYPSSASAFVEIGSTGLSLNLEGVGRFHHVVRNGARSDLLDGESAPVIIPADSGQGMWLIELGESKMLFTDFEKFTEQLNEHLSNDGLTVRRVGAVGHYDDGFMRLTAKRVVVTLQQ